MQEWTYEWDLKKDRKNRRIHGISFEMAVAVFNDPMIYEYHDIIHSGYNKYGDWEDRYIALGMVNRVLFVVYTVRMNDNKEICRLISARKAKKTEIGMYDDWCQGFGGDQI